jgi:hypothetical protein
MATSTDRFVAACPQGHRANLLLRLVVDVPVVGARADGSGLEPDLTKAEVQEGEGDLGVDGGVWCPACEEWYEEEDCVRGLPRRGSSAP